MRRPFFLEKSSILNKKIFFIIRRSSLDAKEKYKQYMFYRHRI